MEKIGVISKTPTKYGIYLSYILSHNKKSGIVVGKYGGINVVYCKYGLNKR